MKTTTTTSSNKKMKTTTSKWTLTSLPEDLVLSIIARVPILFYPILSLVSKSFRTLVASPSLYKARSLLGRRESRLYVCVDVCDYYKNGPSWFTLCRKPDGTSSSSNKEDVKSGDYVLARVPIPHSPWVASMSLVAVGSDIYNVSALEPHSRSSSSVSILDCTSHTWRQGPSLPVELFRVSATLLDQKIYVAGLCEEEEEDGSDSKKNSLAVLDTKTHVCDVVPVPRSLGNGRDVSLSTCVGGKVSLVIGSNVVDYNPTQGSWEEVGDSMPVYMRSRCFCKVDDVLYSCSYDRVLRWYDPEARTWNHVKGLVGLPKLPRGTFAGMADYGGKLAVLWHQICFDREMLWCVQIALERPNTCEIWGNVEWRARVLDVPYSSLTSFHKVLSATL
ncbi:hypothetical protein CARUB_v10007504mg [Capsella rubella]|uniref:F-box domain-containing protein n=1 Tax=Capsella rubella TaxID=81985 RepID=R0GXF4_9BRAS|nr:F-box/kelch-repeat protein At4g25710 [Capsella rubella]EOA15838.1 hypothetical protein CARUB_v10007504mg [Capsella rubella]